MILDMIARLPGLTEVDGSINPLEENRRHDKDLKLARDWFDCIGCGLYYNASGFIFIPWNYTSPSQLRLTRNTSLNPDNFGFKPSQSPYPRRHVTFHNRQSSLSILVIRHFCLLSINYAQVCWILQIADRNWICRMLIYRMPHRFFYRMKLARSSSDLPKFGVNICPLHFGIK